MAAKEMIPFDLAEKMKRAGFPQKYPGLCPCGNYEGDLDGYCGHGADAAVYYPILEEVLAELGEDFDVLCKLRNGWYAGSNKTDFPHGNRIEVAGWETPLAAACRLYIAVKEII